MCLWAVAESTLSVSMDANRMAKIDPRNSTYRWLLSAGMVGAFLAGACFASAFALYLMPQGETPFWLLVLGMGFGNVGLAGTAWIRLWNGPDEKSSTKHQEG